MEGKGHLVRFAYADFSLCWLLVSSDRGCSPRPDADGAGGSSGHPPGGSVRPSFRRVRGRQRTFVHSQLPSVQNSPYSQVAYFGVAHSDPLHLLGLICLSVRERFSVGDLEGSCPFPSPIPPSWDSLAFPINNY